MATAELTKTEVGETALANLRSRMDVAMELARQYGSVTKIENPKDYELVRVAIGEHRTLRVAVEKERKTLVDGAVKWQRDVNTVAKEITAEIEASEERLKAIKQAVDDQKENERKAKAEAERLALEAKIKAEREAEEARLKAQREAEEAKLKADREEVERQAAAIRAEREAFAKAKREAEEEARKAREKVEADAREAQAKIEAEQAKLRAEKERLDRLEFERQAREKAEAEAKAKAEADRIEAERQKAEAEEQAKRDAERAEALKPDKEKIAAFAKKIRALKPPTCQTEEGSKIIVLAMAKILETAEYLEDFATEPAPAGALFGEEQSTGPYGAKR
jgi:DNA repair exonuclease SbcCD ATPase subunit